jgi:hypothetical protein
MGGGESHGSQAAGTAGLPKHLPVGGKEILLTRGLYFSQGFFFSLGKNDKEERRMKTFWIGMMAVTLVLGTGIVAVVYILGKMTLSYVKFLRQTRELI